MTPFITFRIIKLALYSWFFYLLVSSRVQLSNNVALRSFQKNHDIPTPEVVNLLIAHPDDEVMFFSPTLTQLQTLDNHNISFNIVCFSNGDAEGLGNIRAKELNESIALLLRNHNYQVHLFNHKDGMNETWDQKLMLSQLNQIIDPKQNNLLITFDSDGVSGHINHRTCHSIAMKYRSTHDNVMLLLLDSYGNNLLKKYSAFALELVKVMIHFLFETYERFCQNKFMPAAVLNYYNQKLQSKNNDKITFFIPFPKYVFAYATMLNAHKSQVVWFRYGWWAFSRFVFVNDLQIV